MNYSPVDYYVLGNVYPRTKLREVYPRRQRLFNLDILSPVVEPTIEESSMVEEYGFSIFQALEQKLKYVNQINLGSSGFLLSDTKLPYVNIFQVTRAIDSRNSCGSRFERCFYNINAFCETQDEVIDLTNKLENIYDYSKIKLTSPYRFTNLYYHSLNIQELAPQLFRGIYSLEIVVEKYLTSKKREYLNIETSGENLFAAIANRYKQFSNLWVKVNDICTSAYTRTNIPQSYVVIPQLASSETERTSKSRIKDNHLTFSFFAETLYDIELIQQEIELVYDYCKLRLNDEYFLMFDWESFGIIEVEPGFWQGTINYNLLTEKDIPNGL